MTSRYFVKFNANPWGNNIGDCAIRSVSYGLGLDYKNVCKRLGVSYKNGHGLVRDTGIDLYDIQREFDEYFDNVENYDSEDDDNIPPEFREFAKHDPFYDKGEFNDIKNQPTLQKWMIENSHTGKYLVGLDSESRADGHIVFVDTDKMKFYDTWDCSKLKVDSYMRIKKTVTSLKESTEHPLVKVAIYVNQGKHGQNYLDKIISGEKKIETRAITSGRKIYNLMNKYGDIDGQGIAFINDGKIIGYAIVSEIRYYMTKEEFDADYDLHLVSEDDPEYYIIQNGELKPRAGIVFKNKPVIFNTPIDVFPASTNRRTRQSGYIDMTGCEEDKVYEMIFKDED